MKGDYPPEVYTEDEVRRLLAVCSGRGACSLRNRALIGVLYRAGLRIEEALSLHPKDVNIERCTIAVLNGKNNESRIVGIDLAAVSLIRRWLKCREEFGLNGGHRLFCTLHGKPLCTAYIRQLLPRLGRKAGIEKRMHAHGLRHTHASELLTEGTSIAIISKQLGHTSIATTAVYLDHIAPQDVVETMRQRHWRIAKPTDEPMDG